MVDAPLPHILASPPRAPGAGPAVAPTLLACALPYLAVLVGMYAMRSAWVAAVGYHLGMFAVLAINGRLPRARRLFAGGPGWQLGAGVLGGVGAGVLLFCCWPFFGFPADFGAQLAHLGLTAAAWPWFIAYFILVNPWLEELYWRDYLGSAAPWPTWRDPVFAGYHLLVMAPFVQWPWLLITLLAITLAAWLWRQCARLNGGLLVPFVAHALADASIVLGVYWRVH